MKSLTRAAGIGLMLACSPAMAEDGPNLLENPSFEEGLKGYYATFGNCFLNQEYAYTGFNSLKMYGCFCTDYNGNGAVNTYVTNVEPGQVYRVNAWALSASFDSFLGTSSWGGMKIEFRDSANQIVSLAEQRIIEGYDADQQLDVWEQGDFIALAPADAATVSVVPVFLQASSQDSGSMFLDTMSVASTVRDSADLAVNPGFDLGVDYNYQLFPIFNGWTEQYGNIFFDDSLYLTGPFSAGMFGSFPDYDGDGECDPGGVSGLNQLIPDISEGDTVTLSMSAYTPNFDSIVGTGNSVLQKIEFLGDDPADPLDSVAGLLMDGSGSFAVDTWHAGEISGTAPAGTQMIRIVAQIVQPDCEGGSVRIDNVLATTDAAPPSESCEGDFNDDGVVDGADFGALLAVWGACAGCPEDLNDDGFVNGADLGAFLAVWGDCPDDGGGGDGFACDVVHEEPGCNDPICEEIVCNIDIICCQITWDEFCVTLANSNCP